MCVCVCVCVGGGYVLLYVYVYVCVYVQLVNSINTVFYRLIQYFVLLNDCDKNRKRRAYYVDIACVLGGDAGGGGGLPSKVDTGVFFVCFFALHNISHLLHFCHVV